MAAEDVASANATDGHGRTDSGRRGVGGSLCTRPPGGDGRRNRIRAEDDASAAADAWERKGGERVEGPPAVDEATGQPRSCLR